MDEFELAIIIAVADVERAGLVISTVRSRCDFTIFSFFTAAWHPGFDIELAISRSSQIAGCCIYDAVGQSKTLEDLFFYREYLLAVFIALFWQALDEHLKLGELMDSVKAF